MSITYQVQLSPAAAATYQALEPTLWFAHLRQLSQQHLSRCGSHLPDPCPDAVVRPPAPVLAAALEPILALAGPTQGRRGSAKQLYLGRTDQQRASLGVD
jgi:hypothetical protein